MAQSDLYKRALKSYHKLLKVISTEKTVGSTLFHLFDQTVKPILLYGSEVWGTFNTNLKRVTRANDYKLERGYEKIQAENLLLKLCRYVLGVHPKTTIAAIRGDTGRFPLYMDIASNVLKYLHNLNKAGCSNFLKDALLCNQELATREYQCWYTSVIHICNELSII